MEITALQKQDWGTFKKMTFRFFCCFFIIYLFPFPIDSIPFLSILLDGHATVSEWYAAPFEAYNNGWHKFIPWVGKNIIGLKTPITIFTNGSGDTTYDYVLLFTHFSFSIFACIVWTIFDRKRKSYNQAIYWLQVLVRYYLASAMIGYGMVKVFHLQMPFPYLSQLVQTFGDKSPMGLAWSFIGYSKAYSAYTGWAEVVGGFLLLFSRTTLLGSLVVFIVTLNIAMINYCYDVPVKLYSSVLLLMALFLMAPDVKRVFNVLLGKGTVEKISFPSMLKSTKTKMAWLIIKAMFIISLLYSTISGAISSQEQYGDLRKLPQLYGIYNTETVIRNNDTILPLGTDSTRWKQLIIQFENNAQVKMMNDSLKYYNFIVNDSLKNILMYSYADTANKSTLFYQKDSTSLIITGLIGKDSIQMKFKKFDINKFRLVNRGFHWVNEYPYNR